MKKIFALVIWIALLLSVSLLTTSLAAANTVDHNPGNLSEKAPSIPLVRSGGPDTFGYTYQDEVDIGVYHPNFDSADISSTGTGLAMADDDAAANITAADLAGFNFSFYGTAVTNLRVGNNGAILVNAGLADKISFSNVCLDYSSAPANIIAPWWDDWDKTAASSIYWQREGSGNDERLIIEWHNMQHYQAATYTNPVTFKVILYEQGNLIEFHYDDATSNAGITLGASGTIGIRSSSTDYLEYSCEMESLVDQRAIRFQQSTLTIVKDASPQATQGFSFTTTIPDHIGFSLYDDTDPLTPDREITHPLPGVYTVSEAAVANWDLTSLTCTSDIPPGNTITLSTRTAVIDMAPGEHVTCTFLNVNTGNVVIQKVTAPVGTSQVFTFTGNLPGYNTFLLDNNSDGTYSNTLTVTGLMPGSYMVSEQNLTGLGWDLTGLTCLDPDSGTTIISPTATIDLDADETVTCTFENTRRGTITIIKNAIPDHVQDFTFTGSGGIGSFTLDDDPTSVTSVNSQTISVMPGSYTVTEGAVDGWDLSNLTCADPDNGSSRNGSTANIDVDPGETVICTFENTRRGNITIIKNAIPDNDQDFTFTGSSSIGSFSLDDYASSATPVSQTFTIAPGSYTVQENSTSGWTLTGLTCNDPDNGTTTAGSTATIDLDADETIDCTFTNTVQPGHITIIKDAVPNNSQDFSFTSDVPDHLSFSLDDDPTNSDLSNTRQMLNLTSGTYTINEETLPSGWSLTNLVCDGGGTNTSVNLVGRLATIGLDAGENVTCVFTNTNSTIDESADVYLPLVLKNW